MAFADRHLNNGPHVEQAKAIGPDHVHHQHHEDGGRDQGETQVTLLVPEVHEVHDRKARLNEGYRQHTHEQLGGMRILIGECHLHTRRGQGWQSKR